MTPHDAVAAVRSLFGQWAANGRAEDMARSHIPFVRRAFALLDLQPTSWYLDIGCGTGYTVRWAAERVREGRAVGIDLAPEMVALAREQSRAYDNVAFHVAAFPEHALPLARFDVIFSMEVFYYLPDVAAALEATLALARPGGMFACMVDYYRENVASHSWPAELGVPMTLLDAAGWRRALSQAGFTIVEQRRIRLPRDEATAPWKSEVGSLLTIGRRPPAAP